MNEFETVKKPKFVDKLWETVKGIDGGRLSGSFFQSIKIQGDIVTIEVSYQTMSWFYMEMREYMMPNNYVIDMLKSRFGREYILPEGFEFFFQFAGYNFIVVKNSKY